MRSIGVLILLQIGDMDYDQIDELPDLIDSDDEMITTADRKIFRRISREKYKAILKQSELPDLVDDSDDEYEVPVKKSTQSNGVCTIKCPHCRASMFLP